MRKWRLSIHQGIVLIEFDTGTVINPDILKSVYQELNSDPDKYRTTNTVWDLRNIRVDPALGFDEILQLVNHIQSSWDENWQSEKSAMVVKSKEVFGVSRIYASLVADQMAYKVHVFENDLQAAIDWAQPSA